MAHCPSLVPLTQMGLNEVSTRGTYRLSAQGLFERESETTDVKRLFFLSVEGARTEKSYFDNLNRVLKELGVDNAPFMCSIIPMTVFPRHRMSMRCLKTAMTSAMMKIHFPSPHWSRSKGNSPKQKSKDCWRTIAKCHWRRCRYSANSF